MAARLREHYQKNVVPALVKEFGYKNIMAVPKVEKISLNIGLGEATQNPQADGRRGEGTRAHRRPEAGDDESEEVDRRFQAARGHVDRLHGDACAATACTSFSTGW